MREGRWHLYNKDTIEILVSMSQVVGLGQGSQKLPGKGTDCPRHPVLCSCV